MLGCGPKNAQIALVGERPGREEHRRGKPFVGPAGREMDRYLLRANIDRADCYVTNLLKDYREGDPDPTPTEIMDQEPALLEELWGVQPAFIGAIGRFSARYFLGDISMESAHGLAFKKKVWDSDTDTVVVPIYHPAAGLYDPEMQALIQDDFLHLGHYVSGRLPARPPVDEFPEPEYTELTDADAKAIQYLFVGNTIAVDTEGDERDPWCLSFSSDGRGSAYVIRAGSKRALRSFGEAILVNNSLVVLHNSLYDIPVLRALGIKVPRYTDTMVMAYLLQLEPQGLKPLSYRHMGMAMQDYQDVIREPSRRLMLEYLATASKTDWGPAPEYIEFEAGQARVKKPHSLNRRITSILKDLETKEDTDPRDRWKKIQRELRGPAEEALGVPPRPTLDDIPLPKAIYYAGRDADATRRLLPVLEERVQVMELDPVLDMDLAIIPMVERMQANGIAIDVEHFRRLSVQFQAECDRRVHQIYEVTGRVLNPGSSVQVEKFLFKDLKLVPGKRTKGGGHYSTGDKILWALAREHPVVPAIIEYRKYAKLRNSFADVLPRLVHPDGRIRCTLRITRVNSGRLAASEPALQQQPAKAEDRIREGFVAPPGRRLAAWDLDQVEMRVMAHESQDPKMLDLFRTGRDIHSATAAAMFGVRLEDVDPLKHRYPAKRVGFGIVNGLTGAGLQEQMVVNGIYTYSVDDCTRFIADWFEIYPGVKEMQARKRTEARRHGYVRDISGRVRYLPGVWSDIPRIREAALRMSHAHAIQAGAQSIIKKAMKLIWDLLQDTLWPVGVDAEPLLQIHDELLFEIPDDDASWGMLNAFVVGAFESAVQLSVPITAKGGYGCNWGAVK